MVTVRRADPADAQQLGEIHAASWKAAYGLLFEPEFTEREIEKRRRRWYDRATDPDASVLLASFDGRALALSYAMASPTRPGLAEIYSFYCHPDGWGHGVAATLMTETLHMLRNDGVALAHLWTLRATAQSRRFYTKCGFAETGAVRPHDFGDGHPHDQLEYQRAC